MNESKQRAERVLLDWPVFVGLTSRRGWKTDAKRAQAIGVDPSMLSRLKSGKCQPSPSLIYNLPDLLGVPTKALFYLEEAQEQ